MGKIMALDLGDQWVGSALSDSLKILARPYKTVPTSELIPFLQQLLTQEPIDIIVIGYPKTMGGKESEQTRKVLVTYQTLTSQFPALRFVLWDERLSSKRAEAINRARTREEKIKSHSVAAAFILDSYLTFLAHQQEQDLTNAP
jgi:putative holliday junction resolvase